MVKNDEWPFVSLQCGGMSNTQYLICAIHVKNIRQSYVVPRLYIWKWKRFPTIWFPVNLPCSLYLVFDTRILWFLEIMTPIEPHGQQVLRWTTRCGDVAKSVKWGTPKSSGLIICPFKKRKSIGYSPCLNNPCCILALWSLGLVIGKHPWG